MFRQQHPGAAPKPAEAPPEPKQQGAEDVRDDAYRRLRQRTKHLGRQQKRYLKLLRRFSKGYDAHDGTVMYDLTDAEAAAWLEIPRSSITGRRNELCGGSGSSEQIKKQPLVVPGSKRLCQINGTRCQAWSLAPGLFD